MEFLVAEKKNKVDVWFEMWSDVWVGGFFSHLMVLFFVNINCHMESMVVYTAMLNPVLPWCWLTAIIRSALAARPARRIEAFLG